MEAFGNADIFFMKFRNNGIVEWAQSAGPSEDYPASIVVQPDGNMFVIANSSVTMEFGNLTVNPVSGRDMFLFRIRD